VFVVTHRPQEQPPGGEFIFVEGVSEAITQARMAEGREHVHVMGGGQVIRQASSDGLVDALPIIIAPVIPGDGNGLVRRLSRGEVKGHVLVGCVGR
jgi:dihydrofolate reductase